MVSFLGCMCVSSSKLAHSTESTKLPQLGPVGVDMDST